MRIGFNACMKENSMCVQPIDPSSASEGSAALCALNVNAVIQEYEGYIRKLAYQFIPRQVICADVLDLEIDELVQTVRIKFWLALSRQKINNYKSYLRRMVHNEAINIQRSSRFNQFLDTDEEGEPYYGNVLLSQNEGTLDPVDIVTEKETISEYIHRVVESATKGFPSGIKAESLAGSHFSVSSCFDRNCIIIHRIYIHSSQSLYSRKPHENLTKAMKRCAIIELYRNSSAIKGIKEELTCLMYRMEGMEVWRRPVSHSYA